LGEGIETDVKNEKTLKHFATMLHHQPKETIAAILQTKMHPKPCCADHHTTNKGRYRP
jgi:hypothetical protein